MTDLEVLLKDLRDFKLIKGSMAEIRIANFLGHRITPMELYLAARYFVPKTQEQQEMINFVKETTINLMRGHPNGATQIMVCFALSIDHEEEKSFAGMFSCQTPSPREQFLYWETFNKFLLQLSQRSDFADHAPKIKDKIHRFFPDTIKTIKEKTYVGTKLEIVL